jgi:alanyl-tRNA synthetase
MRPLTTDQLRQAYLDFFKERGHAVIAGASLVPENDPTVLFTTAGMHPLVPYLMGEPHPAGKRLVDVQRCVRTQDIDEVGDDSHLTMFEMLGNWSLGDYFKEEAIAMSFEFLTKTLEIPVKMLAVTCFAGDADAPKDEESARIWKTLGIPEERIGFLPKAKNWWGPAGQTGPCGPDTEMFYWVGQGEPQGNPATHDAQWMEIWNDVFMQYNKKADGSFEPLPQPNVDTGMGLERVAAVLQGATNVYATDAFAPIIATVDALSQDRAIGINDGRSTRIIADHVKAASFIIADGVRPSNVDQGYVLRRLIRRAVVNGRELGIEGAFTAKVAEKIIAQYGQAYSMLIERKADIVDALQKEEAQFQKTLQQALHIFDKKTEVKVSGDSVTVTRPVMGGDEAFDLVTTYGMPFEMVKEQAADRGIHLSDTFDVDFQRLFEEHQAKSRAGAEQKFKGGLADHSAETTKLHTATHLLNAALQKVLGPHVQQKGSNITAERLRFDFNHADKMTPEQVKEVERIVNEAIAADYPVSYHVTTVDGAKAEGAIGVFDDRYGADVKVYVVGDANGAFSKEICGGPHVARTGMIGSFTIQKEESSSAGVRRIKAVVKGGPVEINVATEQ